MRKIALPMLLLALAASVNVSARPREDGDQETGPRYGAAQTRPREAEPQQAPRGARPQEPRQEPRQTPQSPPARQIPPQTAPQMGPAQGRNDGRGHDNRSWNDNNGGWRGNGNWDRRDDERRGISRQDFGGQDYARHDDDRSRYERRDYDHHWDTDRGRNHWEHNRYDGYRDRYFRFNNGRYFGQQRYWLGDYYLPRGFSTRVWYVGDWLPYAYYEDERFHIDNPWSFNLYDPPIGCHWVRVGADALLIDYYSGEILEVVYSLFW